MKKNSLKVISVLMAVLLWFYVVNQGDLNPQQNVVTANLEYINLQEGLSIIAPETVSVKIWGLFQEPEEVVAYIDVESLTKGTHNVPVQVKPIKGAIFTSVEPDKVEVIIKGEKEKHLSISHLVTRNPALGYELLDVMKNPDKCIIKGEESIVNQVNSVICEIDLADVRGIKSINIPLKALDISGNVITKGVRLVPEQINVYVVVNQNMVTKTVTVSPTIIGDQSDEIQLLSTKVIPDTVNVIAPEPIANTIDELKTEPVDITGKTESFRQEVKVIIPEGIDIYPTKVLVDVNITKHKEKDEEEELIDP
ncbi:MAG TPA: CdaR family protein [Syntrophomonadaceae bacterium]|nr:CdaR family protein [Syntrophomonadaceae bacterium]